MLIYHATHARNLPSCLKEGVCTRYSQNRTATVWGVKRSMVNWAFAHVLLRHGWAQEPPVVLEIEVAEESLHRFKGGLFYSFFDFPPESIKRVLRLEDIAKSPTKGAA